MPTQIQETIAEEIERLIAAEFTYAEIADALDVSWRSIRRWHHLQSKPYRARTILRLLRELR